MIERIARLFPYLLLFPALLPLVYIDGLLYPYLTPKTLLFRADAIFALAAFVTLALSGRAFFFSRVRNWVTWIPAALLIVAYISSFFGVDFYHSFWSIFDRGDGLLTFSCIVAFFYLILFSADRAFIERLMKWIAIVATVVAAHALLQWLQTASGLDIPLIPDTRGGRIGGTLGNAAFLAGYLGMTLFVTLSIAPHFSLKWRRYAYWSAGAQVLAIVGTATRGTLLALLVAAGLALLYIAWRGAGTYRTYARGGLVGLIIVAGLFIAFRSQLSQVPFEPVARLASISVTDATVESRLFIYANVLTYASAAPLLGFGAEHIEPLFNSFYDPTAIIEQWFDRTHNAFLDYFVQYGIVGLSLYLLLIVLFAREAVQQMRKGDKSLIDGKLFVLLIVVYVLQNMFLFDTATTLLLFMVLFAGLLIVRDTSLRSPLNVPRLHVAVPLGVGALLAFLIVPVFLNPLRANLYLADGYKYHVFDARRAIDSIRKGYALGTYGNLEYGYQLYEMYSERQVNMLSGEARILAYRLAEDILSKNYEAYPYDARTAVYYAHVLDLTPPEIERNDEHFFAVIQRAVELSPKRIQPRYLKANFYIRQGDALSVGNKDKEQFYRDGIAVLEEYSALVPSFAEPRYVLATMYLLVGDEVSAEQWASSAFPLYTPDLSTARRAARYYLQLEDWEHARIFLSDVVDATSDPATKYDLAKAEFLSGNRERAVQLVEELKVEVPGLVEQDEAFMAAIEQ